MTRYELVAISECDATVAVPPGFWAWLTGHPGHLVHLRRLEEPKGGWPAFESRWCIKSTSRILRMDREDDRAILRAIEFELAPMSVGLPAARLRKAAR